MRISRYIGSAFIATEEARAFDAYKQAIVDGNSDDIVYSNLFTGVHGNYLAPSIRAAGLDPDNLPVSDPSTMNFGGDAKKAWKDIWGCGQGIGAVDKVQSAGDLRRAAAPRIRGGPRAAAGVACAGLTPTARVAAAAGRRWNARSRALVRRVCRFAVTLFR